MYVCIECKNCQNFECKNFFNKSERKNLSNFKKCEKCKNCVINEKNYKNQNFKRTRALKKIYPLILNELKNLDEEYENIKKKTIIENLREKIIYDIFVGRKNKILKGIKKSTIINYLFLQKFWDFNLLELDFFFEKDYDFLFEKEIKFFFDFLKINNIDYKKLEITKEELIFLKKSDLQKNKKIIKRKNKKLNQQKKNKKLKIKKSSQELKNTEYLNYLTILKENILSKKFILQKFDILVDSNYVHLKDHRKKKITNFYDFLNGRNLNLKEYQLLSDKNILKFKEFGVERQILFLKNNKKYFVNFKTKFEKIQIEYEKKFVTKLEDNVRGDFSENMWDFFNLGEMKRFLDKIS